MLTKANKSGCVWKSWGRNTIYMPETIGKSYPIDPWEFLMFPVLFLDIDLRYRRGRGSCSALVAYGETWLCLTALLVLALEIIDIKMINIFLESGNYLSSWERMGNRSLRYIHIGCVPEKCCISLQNNIPFLICILLFHPLTPYPFALFSFY